MAIRAWSEATALHNVHLETEAYVEIYQAMHMLANGKGDVDAIAVEQLTEDVATRAFLFIISYGLEGPCHLKLKEVCGDEVASVVST